MSVLKAVLAAAIASASTAAWGNYVGTLRPPASLTGISPTTAAKLGTAFYGFTSPALLGLAPTLTPDPGYRMKLGYKPSRYFSIEGEYVDFGRNSSNPFANPAILSSGFRSTGFGIDTTATLPIWRQLSLYGRMGAYRGDARPAFAPYSTSLLNDATRGTRMRYGLGMQYDFTKSLGIRAELERYSLMGHALAADTETDTISVGVMWRF
jgi:OmpA-OmpF porin, OOP family